MAGDPLARYRAAAATPSDDFIAKFRTRAATLRPEPERITSVVSAEDLAKLGGPSAEDVRREARRRAAPQVADVTKRIVRGPDS